MGSTSLDDYVSNLDNGEIKRELDFLIGEAFFSGIRGQLSAVLNTHIHGYFERFDDWLLDILSKGKTNYREWSHEDYKNRGLKLVGMVNEYYEALPLSENEPPTRSFLLEGRALSRRLLESLNRVYATEKKDAERFDEFGQLCISIIPIGEKMWTAIETLQRRLYERTGEIYALKPTKTIDRYPPEYQPLIDTISPLI